MKSWIRSRAGKIYHQDGLLFLGGFLIATVVTSANYRATMGDVTVQPNQKCSDSTDRKTCATPVCVDGTINCGGEPGFTCCEMVAIYHCYCKAQQNEECEEDDHTLCSQFRCSPVQGAECDAEGKFCTGTMGGTFTCFTDFHQDGCECGGGGMGGG